MPSLQALRRQAFSQSLRLRRWYLSRLGRSQNKVDIKWDGERERLPGAWRKEVSCDSSSAMEKNTLRLRRQVGAILNLSRQSWRRAQGAKDGGTSAIGWASSTSQRNVRVRESACAVLCASLDSCAFRTVFGYHPTSAKNSSHSSKPSCASGRTFCTSLLSQSRMMDGSENTSAFRKSNTGVST